MKNISLQEAARHYIHPLDEDGHLSYNYRDGCSYVFYEQKFGQEAWQDAVTKARTEYKFGSKAVKW